MFGLDFSHPRTVVIVFAILASISEIVFSGVLNGWSSIYMILNPKTSREITMANWIYAIGNMVSMAALVPQGLLIDCVSNRGLFLSHAVIGVFGYIFMIFASAVSLVDSSFCESSTALTLWIITQILTSICSNGMHLAIMCHIPNVAKSWSEDVGERGMVANILYTITNGFYAAGPLILWILWRCIGVRNWNGILTYAGITIILLIVNTILLKLVWIEQRKVVWPPQIQWDHFQWLDLIEFTVYNTTYIYFMICFVSMVTVRTPQFTNTFSLMLPLIGLAMTVILSLTAQYWSMWYWNAWMNKFIVITLVGLCWVFLTLLHSCIPQGIALWIGACVMYCIFCPIYFSTVAIYFDSISPSSSRGLLRGLIMAVSGPLLFSIPAWISHGKVHSYLAYEVLATVTMMVVAAFILLRHVKSW